MLVKSYSKILVCVVICLVIYGFVSVLASFVHELGHLLFASAFNAQNLKIDFHLFSASYANWTGVSNWLTTAGGVILSLFVGLLVLIIKRVRRNSNLIDTMIIFFAIELIPSRLLYLGISVLIKWGDGYKLVSTYGFNPLLVVIISCGFGLVCFAKLYESFYLIQLKTVGDSIIRNIITISLFVGVILFFKFMFGDPFKYTAEYILVIYFFMALSVVALKHRVKMFKLK